jgi:pimeloyl-ACP methyl ester carboxylesterase
MNKIYLCIKHFVLIGTVVFFLSHMTFLSATTINISKNKCISYTDMGAGTPLVLIHAFPTDQRLWEPQLSLKKYFRIITLDLWGFGHSSSVNGQAVSMSDYADEVKLLLDKLNIKNAIIGGESMGGYIALAFLEKYPDKIAGLILSDTQSIADNPEQKAKREATATDVLEHGTANLIADFMTKAVSPNASERLKGHLRQILKNQPASAMASALRGMAARNDTSILLANSLLPILIITGDEDILISPQQSERMQQLAKNSKLMVIKNAGHLSNLEQPKQWNLAVIDMFYKKQ